MTDHIYKHVRITGTSKVSSDEAIKAAIAKAAQTIHGMRWFEVVDSLGIFLIRFAPNTNILCIA